MYDVLPGDPYVGVWKNIGMTQCQLLVAVDVQACRVETLWGRDPQNELSDGALDTWQHKKKCLAWTPAREKDDLNPWVPTSGGQESQGVLAHFQVVARV